MKQFAKKICLVGDLGVGKTSLVRRFVYNLFDDKYLATIGVKVSRKTMVVAHANELVEVVMMLWDLASAAEFEELQTTYLRGASGVILVCDLARVETIERLAMYADVVNEATRSAPCVIAANKVDLITNALPPTLQAVTPPLRAPTYLTSAKTDAEVDSLFQFLGARVIS